MAATATKTCSDKVDLGRDVREKCQKSAGHDGEHEAMGSYNCRCGCKQRQVYRITWHGEEPE